MKGIKDQRNDAGFCVLTVHYSADPDKDPDTDKGREWYNKTRQGYSMEGWEREFEINFTMGGGNKMFHDFSKMTHTCKLKYDPRKILYRTWDFGYHHPAVLFAQINDINQLCVLRELQGNDVALHQFKNEVKVFTEEHFPITSNDGMMDKKLDNNEISDILNHIRTKDFCDPAGADVSDLAGIDYIKLMRKPPYRVVLRFKRIRKQVLITLVRNALLIRNDGKPTLLIDEKHCPILVGGLEGGYCSKKNKPDIPAEDTHYEHTQDDLQYLFGNLYRKLGLRLEEEKAGEEKRQIKNKQVPLSTRDRYDAGAYGTY